MAESQFRSPGNLEKWLRERNRRDSVVIASRVALRELPLISEAVSRGSPKGLRRFSKLALAIFRANALARVAGKYPNRANELSVAAKSAGSAADVAAGTGVGASAAEAVAAATAVAAANAARRVVAATATFAAAADAASRGAAVATTVAPVIWEAVYTDVSVLATRGAAALSDMPLWPAVPPPWIADAWTRLRRELPEGESWRVWTDWYDAVLAGRQPWPGLDAHSREDLEVAICALPNGLWKRGPTSANIAVAHLIDDAYPPAISGQGPGPRFALGETDTIIAVPHWEYDDDGNIPRRVQSLLPLAQRAASDLVARLGANAASEIRRDAADYHAAINRDASAIDWGEVYGLGVFLENAAVANDREIEDRMLPSMEDPARAALDSVLTLHSNLIMASGEGRALQDDADRLRLTREQQQAVREDAQVIATGLSVTADVAAPEAAATVARAADAIGRGPHPERGTQFGLATIANVAVVAVSAGTLGSFAIIGGMLGGPTGFITGAGTAWVGYEGLKKSVLFANATAALGGKFDLLVKSSAERTYAELVRLAPFRRFVCVNEVPLRRIAENTPRLRWMLRYIDFIVGSVAPRPS